jgi:hypothetical protein
MNPEVRRSVAIVSTISILGTLFVGLRLWTRYMIVHALGLDDLLITLAWVCGALLQIGVTVLI